MENAAEPVGMDYRTIRKYFRNHSEASDSLEYQAQDTLDQVLENSFQLQLQFKH